MSIGGDEDELETAGAGIGEESGFGCGAQGSAGQGDGSGAVAPLPAARFEAVLSSISDGVFTIDGRGLITCFNRAAEKITGYTRQDAIGQPCHTIFKSSICKDTCVLRYTMETDRPVVDLMVYIQTADGEEIPVSISTALFRDNDGKVVGGVETFRDLRQVESLRKQVEESYSFADIVTKSPKMTRILDILPTIAESESTVLVTGESGTGKELVARAIHSLSPRAKGRFVAINCAGIPDTLLEAELFGYEAGAFTGAVKAKPGRFALADGGTLFLDEIGDMPLQLQAKLLRVLQDGSYEPLGGVRTETANVRIAAATNRVLADMVSEKTFREDLFYRLKVVEIRLPPLRERMEDVPLLTDHFVRELGARKNKHVAGVSPNALRALMAHGYPGNVRELHNIVEHGFVLATGRLIRTEHLPDWVVRVEGDSAAPATLEDLEKSFLVAALRANSWNRLATAKQLGIHKTTLFRKIRKLEIELPDTDGRSRDR